MSFTVLLTHDAVCDLNDLYEYLALHEPQGRADRVLDRIERIFTSLAESPNRGAFPKELLAIGIREYREIFFKPYRIIYRIIEKKVYILLIADGRRDMDALLQRRLLR